MLREQRVSMMTEFGGGVTIETLYSECVHSFEKDGIFTEGVGEAVKKIADKVRELFQKIIDKIHEILGKIPKKIDKNKLNTNVAIDKKEFSKVQKIRALIKKIIEAPANKLYDAFKNHKGALSVALITLSGVGAINVWRRLSNDSDKHINEYHKNNVNFAQSTLISLQNELQNYEKLEHDTQRDLLRTINGCINTIKYDKDQVKEKKEYISVLGTISTLILNVTSRIINALTDGIDALLTHPDDYRPRNSMYE